MPVKPSKPPTEEIRTVRIPFRATPEQTASLRALRPSLTAAYNDACAYAYEHPEITSAIKLHHALYRILIDTYRLPSQFVCDTLRRAYGSVQAVRSLAADGQTVSCPHADRDVPIPYNARTLTLNPNFSNATMATGSSRIHVCFTKHPHLERYASDAARAAGWTYGAGHVTESGRNDGVWILSLTFSRPLPKFLPVTAPVVGCDRGFVVPAALSTGELLGDPRTHATERRFRKTQSSLQRKGTRSALRLLRRRAGRWSRFRVWADHNLTKAILRRLKPGTRLAMEDLTGIRRRGRRWRRSYRWRLHGWSFRRQQEMLLYKAPSYRVEIAFVDPRHTSQRCSACGYIARKNRRGRRFVCRNPRGCSHAEHADLNAAKNIAAKWRATPKEDSPPVAVNPPHATTPSRARREKTGTAVARGEEPSELRSPKRWRIVFAGAKGKSPIL